MTPLLRASRLSLLLVATLACLPAVASSTLDGAWRLEAGEFVDGEGQLVDYAALKLQGLKVIADGHFAFTSTQDGRFWAGGSGSFVADAERYVETPTMASYPLHGDGSYRFSYTLEGDTWTLERHEDGRRVEREVWRRVGDAR
ncbi:hypothetical protein [Pseudoxanthomonas suwonensis]|uniref:Secreted protein n=1 Tax=Pseudoxanthomonas suwonensis TaxID=314722 RepID=A0A0E3Z194_9GAMM|nr:hypothetical protein [Pseudoxanthomonas suwonensis]AKC85517.1 hypothetical protein WQ53_00775 [Pseudoxanthomonas suwonensis]